MNIDEFERIFRPQHTSAGPHTLDSPVRYEVWKRYALAGPGVYVDLLLEPKLDATKTLTAVMGERASQDSRLDVREAKPAVTGGLIAIKLPFSAFVQTVIPQTTWRDLTALGQDLSEENLVDQLEQAATASHQGASHTDRAAQKLPPRVTKRLPVNTDKQNLLDRFRWFIRLIAAIGSPVEPGQGETKNDSNTEGSDAGRDSAELQAQAQWLKEQFDRSLKPVGKIMIDVVSENRVARGAVVHSRETVKADAAHRLFELDCTGVGWAVLDSGIDARHPAFRRHVDPETGQKYDADDDRLVDRKQTRAGYRLIPRSRVVATYDLANAREEFAGETVDELQKMRFMQYVNANKIDLFPEGAYEPPKNDHGTHIAGILSANWKQDGQPKMVGIAPDLDLWDIRVLRDDGEGDEFGVVAGLRLVEEINRNAGRLVIHGINLSVSITHQVANFACGWTPVCNACSDLVDSGVVVVVSAGNAGFTDFGEARRAFGASYETVSITDPGNVEKVITVGSTHAQLPHRYGISYFSSRGPTADGRRKPDLLAPGEGITGPIPLVGNQTADYKAYDGTSQAAPHVSGAAALLMARYPALRGQPTEVKKLLCDSATDLGRDPYFQGHGLLDVLRALQSR